MENGQQVQSHSFFLLLLFTSFCLHVSLERNINFIHEISHMKYNAIRKFLGQNIFIRKRIAKNFYPELFGIEIKANENKVNYGTLKFMQLFLNIKKST